MALVRAYTATSERAHRWGCTANISPTVIFLGQMPDGVPVVHERNFHDPECINKFQISPPTAANSILSQFRQRQTHIMYVLPKSASRYMLQSRRATDQFTSEECRGTEIGVLTLHAPRVVGLILALNEHTQPGTIPFGCGAQQTDASVDRSRLMPRKRRAFYGMDKVEIRNTFELRGVSVDTQSSLSFMYVVHVCRLDLLCSYRRKQHPLGVLILCPRLGFGQRRRP